MRAHPSRQLAVVALGLILALALATSAAATPAVNGTFPVKGIDTNSKIVAGPDGNMWAAVPGAEPDDVARITPTGEVKEFEIEGIQAPSGITVGPEGKLWVTGTNAVASFSTSDPKGTSVATTIITIAGNSPIVTGPDGNLWVASQEILLRIPPTNLAGTTPFPVAELSPRDIDVAGSLLAVADAGAKNRIATFTTAGVEKDFAIGGASQGLAGAPGGQIAFSAPGANPEQSGLITPPNPATSFELAGDPQGVALGSDQAFWIVQFTPGVLERVTSTGVRSSLGGIPPNSSRQIAAGPGNTLWVTLSDPGKEGVARISGLEPPVTTTPPPVAPQTKIAKGPKGKVRTAGKFAKVKFRFSSTTAGVSFECALVKARKLKKGQKAPKPKFKSCKSPKSFSLKPGKYRFWVRAVNAGIADPTPAKRSFSVVHVHKH